MLLKGALCDALLELKAKLSVGFVLRSIGVCPESR